MSNEIRNHLREMIWKALVVGGITLGMMTAASKANERSHKDLLFIAANKVLQNIFVLAQPERGQPLAEALEKKKEKETDQEKKEAIDHALNMIQPIQTFIDLVIQERKESGIGSVTINPSYEEREVIKDMVKRLLSGDLSELISYLPVNTTLPAPSQTSTIAR